MGSVVSGAGVPRAAAWEAHRSKRRRVSLSGEVTETQEEKQRSTFAHGRGRFTDVVVWCGTRSWKAHRAILAERCRFFQTCLEGKFEEAITHTIYLDDDDAAAVELFLEWIYTYSAGIGWTALFEDPGCRTFMHLCRLADKYDQPLLLEQIAGMFRHSIRTVLPSTADRLLALREINAMGDALWIVRIKEYILAALAAPGQLKNLDTECKDFLCEHPVLACQLLERLSCAVTVPQKRAEPAVDSYSDSCSDTELPAARPEYIGPQGRKTGGNS